MTIAEGLERIVTAKESIRQAIESQGVECDTSVAFGEYGDKIRAIPKGSDTDEVYRALMRKNYFGDNALDCLNYVPKRTVKEMKVPAIIAGNTTVTVMGEKKYSVQMSIGNVTKTKTFDDSGKAVFTDVESKEGDECTFAYLNYLGESQNVRKVVVKDLTDMRELIFHGVDSFKFRSPGYSTELVASDYGYILYYSEEENPTDKDWNLLDGLEYRKIPNFINLKIVATLGGEFPVKDVKLFGSGMLSRYIVFQPEVPSVVPDTPPARYEVTFR